jgi:F-type H+-transporting ATPase subunit epsilon
MTLQVELVSPERILYSGDADMVLCRTVGEGDIAFLTGHAPFIGALDVWSVRVKTTDGGDAVAAVHGGFVEVRDDRVIILSDVAELAEQIDVTRARRQKEAAEERLRREPDEESEAEAELARAAVRLQVAEGA